MIYQVPLQTIPSQRLSFIVNDEELEIRIKYLKSGLYMDLWINGVLVFEGLKCINDYNYLKFAPNNLNKLYFITSTNKAPDWKKLDTEDFLLYETL